MRPVALRCLQATLATAMLAFSVAAADPGDAAMREIDALLTAVGRSDCVFIRNGKRYDAEAAEKHLRLKLRRGRRYVSSAETFIERLASKSSMSGKLYYIECPGADSVPSGEWLHERLRQQREAAPDDADR